MSYMESKMQDQIDGASALEQSICNEACDVYKETGQTPRQLAEQVKVLREALTLMVRTHDEPAETLLQEAKESQWLSQSRAALAATDWSKT